MRRTRGWRSERGQSLIEFAIASTVLLMTVFGVVEFGTAIWRRNLLSSLAQEGARWASVRGASNPVGQRASSADVQAYVRSRALGMNVTVTTTPEPSAATPGTTVSVTVQNTYSFVSAFVFGAPITMSATGQMVVVR